MKVIQLLLAFAFGLLGLVNAAFAVGEDLDFSGITGAVSVGTIAAGMIAMGAIMILPGVAKWAAKKLATFFG